MERRTRNREKSTHLFEFVQIGTALELPHTLNSSRKLPRFTRLPVLDKPTLVCGDNGVVSIVVLALRTFNMLNLEVMCIERKTNGRTTIR